MSNLKALERHWSEPEEINIPTPFGHIAAKVWGREYSETVLALHGWQDNAGTFDKLIPLLSSKLHIVAFDSVGHGLSSHKPPGSFYHFLEMVLDIRRIVSNLKWKKFSLIGHSMGGAVSLIYSSIFPESVKNLVLLDVVKPSSHATKILSIVTRNYIEGLILIEKKMLDVAPVYSMAEARSRLISGMNGEITEESADVLLKRGCRPSPCLKGVVFSRDIRLKITDYSYKFSHDDLKSFMKNIKCNMLLIEGKQSFIYKSRSPDVLDFKNIYMKSCKSFQVVEVNGNHFVHLNNPELVAPHVDNFFNQHVIDLSASKL